MRVDQTAVDESGVKHGGGELRGGLQLLEPDTSFCERSHLEILPALLEWSEQEETELVVTNNSGFTQHIGAGAIVGQSVNVQTVEGSSSPITDCTEATFEELLIEFDKLPCQMSTVVSEDCKARL